MLRACDISRLLRKEVYLFCSQLHGLREEIWLYFKNNGLVLLNHKFFLCSFRRFLLDFLRYPRDCFSRNPFALMEHDQKHLPVVYFTKHFFEKGPSLTTTLLITLHIISATDSAVCFSSWYGKLAKGSKEGTVTYFNATCIRISGFWSPSDAVLVSITMSTTPEGPMW